MRIPKKVFVYLSIAVLFFGAVYYFALEKKIERDPKDKLATLTYFRNFVESRYAGEIAWKPAIHKENLFESDALKTHSGAEAVITFVDDAVISVEENSIIIIRRLEQDQLGSFPSFEIVDGNIGVFSGNRFKVITPDGVSDFAPLDGVGRVSIRVNEAKRSTRFSVLEGTGNVGIGDATVELSMGKGLHVQDKRVQKVTNLFKPSRVYRPKDGQTVYYAGDKHPEIVFEFEKSSNRYHLKIAKDEQLASSVLDIYTRESTVKVTTLSEGEYYWSVAEVSEDGSHGMFSKPRKLIVKPSPSSAISTELPEAQTRDIKLRISSLEGKPVVLGENGKPGVGTQGFVRVGDELKTPPRSRVGLSLDGQKVIKVRSGSHIAIKKAVESGPNLDKDVDVLLKEGVAVLTLQKVKNAGSTYKLETANSQVYLTTKDMRRPRSVVVFEKMYDGSAELLVLTGEVPVTISEERRFLQANSAVLFSNDKNVPPRFGKAPVSLIKLLEGTTNKIFYEFEPPLVTFKWPKAGRRFVFEMSANKSFRPLVLSEYTRGNFFTNYAPKGGKFYWRYQDIGGKYSEANEFTVDRVTSLTLATGRAVIYENEPARIVWFDQKSPVIQLAWVRTKGANRYEAEIFLDPELKSRIFSKTVSDTKLSFLADFFHEGTYYWRVNRYTSQSRLIKRGKLKSFTLKRNLSSPTLRIDLPLNNSVVNNKTIVTSGFMFRRADLFINDFEAFLNHEGPFDFKLDLKKGRNKIVYKEEGPLGIISYYVREVTLK